MPEVKRAIRLDTHLQKLIHAIETDKWSDDGLTAYIKMKDDLSLCGGVMLRGNRIGLLAHMGHQGVVKTKSLLRKKVWFQGINRLVETRIHEYLYLARQL